MAVGPRARDRAGTSHARGHLLFLGHTLAGTPRRRRHQAKTELQAARRGGATARKTISAAHDIGRGDRVGIRVPSGTVDLYIAVLGTLLAGAAYVPVDFADPVLRAELIWSEVDACAVITTDLEIVERHRGRGRDAHVRPGDDCWVIFTSGSTGAPKGVVVGHRAAAAFVDAEATLWQVRPDDRVLAGLSVGFDASCEEMWLAWRNGAALVACPRFIVQSGVDLGPWLAERDVTVVSTVPTLAAMWDDEVLAKVRLLILGGEACPNELGWRLAAGREVWNTYGPTEATVVSTATRVWPGRAVTIGHPLRGWKVAVVDELGQPVTFSETGELVIAGVGLGRYLDPELDAIGFAGLPAFGFRRSYHTGDIAREGADGLEFVGRRDDQVKIGGRRIELAEIDAQLCAVPGVKAAATTVRRTAGDNTVLVGYFVGDVDPAAVRARVSRRLPEGIVPLVVRVKVLPLKSSGKVDRDALPWPPPSPDEPSTGGSAGRVAGRANLTGTAAWLSAALGRAIGPAADDLGQRLLHTGRDFARSCQARLGPPRPLPGGGRRGCLQLPPSGRAGQEARPSRRGWPENDNTAVRQWAVGCRAAPRGVLAGRARESPVACRHPGLQPMVRNRPPDRVARRDRRLAAVLERPGSATIVAVARRVLLARLRPGRYPRQGWLSCRLWFVERLTNTLHINVLAGTPWAARYARMNGAVVGRGARLWTLPSPTSLLSIGEGATLEAEVDVDGWWIEGHELVVGEIHIGDRARIGTRALLMPGANVGDEAEIEPGSVVTGSVPAGERWSGSPARRVGLAGETWPALEPDEVALPTASKVRFAFGLAALTLLPLVAAVPVIVVLNVIGGFGTVHTTVRLTLICAPLVAAMFLAAYGSLVAIAVRSVSRLIRPGIYPDTGSTAWALWFNRAMATQARGVLFPLYASVYTRSWLRVLGIKVGRRTEVSTAVGLNRLVSLGDTSFLADDVVFAGIRARGGKLEITPIEVGSRTFLGNGAILRANTRLGTDSLVGVLSSPPLEPANGTSWFGLPALSISPSCRTGRPLAYDGATETPRRRPGRRGDCEDPPPGHDFGRPRRSRLSRTGVHRHRGGCALAPHGRAVRGPGGGPVRCWCDDMREVVAHGSLRAWRTPFLVLLRLA